MIKAVFIDIDETLTNSQREVTEKTKSEIANCVKNGVKIILVPNNTSLKLEDSEEEVAITVKSETIKNYIEERSVYVDETSVEDTVE